MMATPGEVSKIKRLSSTVSLDAAIGSCLAVEKATKAGKERRGEPVLPRRVHPPRNSPCPCGSGKKYKHCHGGK